MANIVAFIPARAGSKGIPGKNQMVLAGKPVIAWTIELAKKSRYINKIVVSTDSSTIAQIARNYGADVPFLRPSEISGDFALDIEAFEHYFNYLESQGVALPDAVVHLRASSPVRDIEIIDKAIEEFMSNEEADSLRSMNMPLQTPYKMWKIGKDGFAEPLVKVDGIRDAQSSPRQVLPEVFWQNGYVDIVRPRAILEHHTMWGKKVLPFIVEKSLFELDYPEDIPNVEAALKLFLQNKDESKIATDKIKRHSV